ncbi:hypothetical protein HPB51_020707 [Rhipicephalus microplus]|uniref:Uncharacterized protein n=1 Tax=Rhipicephalus microplus TaxID=6941 RepID=A0A9J6ECA7_RHIMP|nr:hypothetical protein HPB51_020707 [Rhipicephalus microplus]
MLKKQSSEHEQWLTASEPYSRNRNIEIKGIPQSSDEKLLETLHRVGELLNVPIDESDVEVCHRVVSKNVKDTPNIVAQFKSRSKRDMVLQKAKKMRITSKDFGHSQGTPVSHKRTPKPSHEVPAWHGNCEKEGSELAFRVDEQRKDSRQKGRIRSAKGFKSSLQDDASASMGLSQGLHSLTSCNCESPTTTSRAVACTFSAQPPSGSPLNHHADIIRKTFLLAQEQAHFCGEPSQSSSLRHASSVSGGRFRGPGSTLLCLSVEHQQQRRESTT